MRLWEEGAADSLIPLDTTIQEPTFRAPPAARFLPKRVFYGWYVALACSVLLFVGVGVGYYGLAVFLRPLQEEQGWSNAAVSAATGLYFALGGITGAVVGPLVDRRGPLRFMLAGSLLLGASVALIGSVGSLWQLFALYAVLAVGFGMSTAVGVNSIMTRWFVARRARAMSVAFTGISVGGVVLAPLGTALVERGGLDLAAPVMGALVVAVAVPVLLGVLVWDPSEMGLVADGGSLRLPSGPKREALDDAVQRRHWTGRAAATTGAFWALLGAFGLVMVAQTGFLIHQISFLEDRFGSRSAAALALSTTAGGSIVARLVVGTFADRLDKRLLGVGLFVLQASAVLAVVAVEDRVATYALTMVFGFTIGNIYMMQTLLVGEVFGLVSFGTVFGLLALATQVASGAGPVAVGWLEDVTGSYRLPFTLTATITYAAAALLLLVRPPAREVREHRPQAGSGCQTS